MELIHNYILILAFVADFLLGDPKGLPHLIVGYGKLIAFGEKKLNHPTYQFLKGMALTVILVVLSFAIPYVIIAYLKSQGWHGAHLVFSVIALFYCLANKTLINEGKAVFNTLHTQGLTEGRKRLSWIVGRETSNLSAQQVRIATLETMSENLSDGVVAPLFYFACFGVPGAMAYKMINTLDSMVGYRNENYELFGKFAARLDDVANYLPARITAIAMLLVSLKWKGLPFVFTEGKKHSSPNAGYPEAALAYILSCRFGGPNYYHGKLYNKPYIGTNNREIASNEIKKVVGVNYKTSVLVVGLIMVLNISCYV